MKTEQIIFIILQLAEILDDQNTKKIGGLFTLNGKKYSLTFEEKE